MNAIVKRMQPKQGSLMLARKKAISAIHALKNQAGMSEDEYRTMLRAQTGKGSCSDMDIVELRRVLDHFARLGVKSVARRKLDRVGISRQRLLAKLTAQLSAAGRDRRYLDGMVKRIAKVDALEFCDEQALSKLIAALAIDAERHGRAYP
ncbi:MAG: phage protein GemA/Gp16 family protein [Achromobacter veterisilvae]|uniref:regulatory protein GemA n=1 Tax=Achromobacter sp. RW408 TaxID=2202897 RepID=UPI000D73C299|nr:regulatory protein GemA [Achromobacter sp. RW408]PWY53660.1 regulatory protein GemA [Achromobacter sp. RW408]